MNREPVTHDYTDDRRDWGHDIHYELIDGGMKLDAIGHSQARIQVGDYLIFTNRRSGATTRYCVESVKHMLDPHDMFSAMLVFAPRPEPVANTP